MAINTRNIISAQYASNSLTTEYTSSSVTTQIDKFTAQNDSGGDVTLQVHLVPSGGSADATNLILNRTILDDTTYRCPELIGHTLDPGDFISVIAGSASAIVIMASGRVIS